MKRFRVTILAVCLILGWLGYSDLRLLLNNPEPQEIAISELEMGGAPREWLKINNGYLDLAQAINMSGTMEIDSFLVPLKSSPGSTENRVWFETRDPQLIGVLKTYYFMLESEDQRRSFVVENQQLFSGRRQVTGMTADNLVADSNRDKLTKLLEEMNIPVAENTIFISEGKQPAVWRGIFFFGIAMIGMVKILLGFRKSGDREH